MNDPRGSIWRKWDLHLHTPSSGKDYGDRSVTNEQIVKALKDNHIAAVAITDHHTMDVERYLELRELGGSEVTVFPGIELRSELGGRQQIHFIGIFPEHLEERVLRDLWTELQGKLNLTPTVIEDRGGEEVISCDFETSCELIHDLGGLVTVHAGKKSNSIDELKNGDFFREIQKKDLTLKHIDIMELGRPEDQEGYRKMVFPAIGAVRPLILASDNHDIKGYASNRFVWIKAEPTFEGLKQTLYEPEVRVRIQTDNPSEGEAYTKISSVTISLPSETKIRDEKKNEGEFCFSGKHEMALSNNLTCLIGGRGTGKSTLAHLIYNASGQDSKRLTEINSLLTRVVISPSPLPRIAQLTNCEVPSNAEFFFQNEIEKYAGDINAMSELVKHRLINLSAINGESLRNLTEGWEGARDKIVELVEAWDKCEESVRKINENDKEIETLKKQTEAITSESYKKLQSDLKDLSGELSALELYLKNYQDLRTQADGMKKFIDKLQWDNEQGNDAVNELVIGIDKFLKDVAGKHENYIEKHKKEDVEKRINDKKEELKGFLNEKGLKEENIEELTTANEEIAKYSGQNNELEQGMEPYKEIYDLKEKLVNEYMAKYTSYKERYKSVCDAFKGNLEELNISDKCIDFEVVCSEEKLRHLIVEFIKEELFEESGLRADAIESRLFKEIKVDDYIQNIDGLREHVLNIEDDTKTTLFLKNLFSNKDFVEKVNLRLISEYYDIGNIRVETKFGGNIIKSTSFGERCGIVLAIVLAAGTNPIVIDQPEDHLDGKFTSTVLVPLIRKQKSNRQIILITRDANIVIGGDAELINIFEIEKQMAKITPATIEDLEHREKYIWVLDGGTEAFLKRENKYNLRAGN